MNIARVAVLVARDLGRGPRSPTFLYALVMPVVIALVTKIILLTLFDPLPRLAMADLGSSEIASALRDNEGIVLNCVGSDQEIRRLVSANHVDAGLVLPVGFDRAIRAGQRPLLKLYLSGQSRLTQRLVLVVSTLDLVRGVEGREPPVNVVATVVGEGGGLPVEDLVVLGILLWPLLVCSTLVPGMLLVQEREQRTLDALLVTPTTLREVFAAKAFLGFGMAILMCAITLALCDALPTRPLAMLAALSVAIAFCCELGLIYGCLARDGKSLYNIVQGCNVVILAPLLFYFFPDWPGWIAKIFPTWWIIDPLYRIGLQGASLAEVWFGLVIALAYCGLLAVAVGWLGRRVLAQAGGAA